MNGAATFGDQSWRVSGLALHNRFPLAWVQGEAVTNAMLAFGIAVGGTSLICYALMTRLQNSKRTRRPSGDGSAPDAGNYATGDGWTIASWFASDHSTTDSSGNPSDFGAGDSSGGGGDAGGGGGGGDGGGGGGGSD
jgi:hypothetical protein